MYKYKRISSGDIMLKKNGIHKENIIKYSYIKDTLNYYEEKPVNFTMELIGAVYENGKWNLDNVSNKISIEMFYHLSEPLREKILMHILGNHITAWQLWMSEERRNTPHHMRSGHYFPRIYDLQYIMGDKSRDPVLTELITSYVHSYDEKLLKKKVSTKKKRISVTLKRLVWNKAFGEEIGSAKCVCCNLTTISQLNFHAGHIVSEANGGNTILDNLVPICQSCNSSMGITNLEYFKNKQGFK
jgi:hypothetical protein